MTADTPCPACGGWFTSHSSIEPVCPTCWQKFIDALRAGMLETNTGTSREEHERIMSGMPEAARRVLRICSENLRRHMTGSQAAE